MAYSYIYVVDNSSNRVITENGDYVIQTRATIGATKIKFGVIKDSVEFDIIKNLIDFDVTKDSITFEVNTNED